MQLRERLREQRNVILETRETARGLVVNPSDVLFDTGKYTLKPGRGRRWPSSRASCWHIRVWRLKLMAIRIMLAATNTTSAFRNNEPKLSANNLLPKTFRALL